MSTQAAERLTPPDLTPEQTAMLSAAERLLVESLDRSRAAVITIDSEDGQAPTIAVPPQVLRVVARVLGLMAQGQAVTLVPELQEMTTVEAANFLNVSRPFVVKEIEAGRLPCRKVGTHRRILFKDLTAYAARMRAAQVQALEDMAADARDMGLYD